MNSCSRFHGSSGRSVEGQKSLVDDDEHLFQNKIDVVEQCEHGVSHETVQNGERDGDSADRLEIPSHLA